jgi:hypothetical protein
VSLNLLRAERFLLGQLAAAEDRSLGNFIRELAYDGLRNRNPAVADRLTEVRRRRRAALLAIVGLYTVLVTSIPGHAIDLRRPPPRTSVTRRVQGND